MADISKKKFFLSSVLICLILLIGWNKTQAAINIGKASKYSYTMAADKAYNPDEYTRKEIESFLSACVPGYIRAEDLARKGETYHVKAREIDNNQRKLAESAEINKWFEDQVTVTSKGKLTVLDIDTIIEFFKKINRVIGKEKFVYKPGLEVANIVIELAPPGKSLNLGRHAGETSLLQDNLRVRITTSDRDMKPHIETYTSKHERVINESRIIKFYPRELEFMKNNRLVKVYMKNILDPHTRYFAFIHELLHSIGFHGHSPYDDSHLFPLPVKAFPGTLPILRNNNPLITPLAERMVEILYRPEILPGMTVKEAGSVLTGLKRIDKCSKNEIAAYLKDKKKQLEKQKNVILEKEKKEYNRRMNQYIELDKIIVKEQRYLEELEEIRSDYGLEASVVKDIKADTTKLEKLVRIRQELILSETQKKQWLKKSATPKSSKEAGIGRRELKRLGEEIIVLKDLLKVEEEIAALEQHILASDSSFSQKQLHGELRRTLRQLYTIDNELLALN